MADGNERAKLVVDSTPNAVTTPRLSLVPEWLYTDTVPVGVRLAKCCGEGRIIWFRITKASFIWIANLLACAAHVGFAIVSVIAATRDGNTMATPLLTVYLTNLTWVPNSTNALIPRYEEAGGLYLAHMTLWFFLLSAIAHGTVCLLNWRQAFALDAGKRDKDWAKITYWTGWYYVYIVSTLHLIAALRVHATHASLLVCTARVPQPASVVRVQCVGFAHGQCAVATSNSARCFRHVGKKCSLLKLMRFTIAVVFAVAGGLSHVYIITMVFSLMFCTMMFGYFAERLCRPINRGPDKKPLYWAMNQFNPHLLIFNLDPEQREWNLSYMQARLNRLGPHVAGYIPYITVWACLLHSFLYNVNGADQGPPDFVWFIIISQITTFSLFGITQLVLLSRTDGPDIYYWGERKVVASAPKLDGTDTFAAGLAGEFSYQVLSIMAKGLLGGGLIVNVLIVRHAL